LNRLSYEFYGRDEPGFINFGEKNLTTCLDIASLDDPGVMKHKEVCPGCHSSQGCYVKSVWSHHIKSQPKASKWEKKLGGIKKLKFPISVHDLQFWKNLDSKPFIPLIELKC